MTMCHEIFGELKRLEAKPGDVFVLTVHGGMTAWEEKIIRDTFNQRFPDNDLKLVVLSDNMILEVEK